MIRDLFKDKKTAAQSDPHTSAVAPTPPIPVSTTPPPSNGATAAPANPFAPSPGGATPFNHAAPQNAAKTTAGVLGEIVWLMSQSPLHKQFFISDLEWFAMTPILLQQFRMFFDTQKPIGVLFWANVSDEVEQRLSTGGGRLQPQDWKSGDKLWVVEVVAPFGGAEAMVADLKEKVFPAKEIKMLVTSPDGKREIRKV